MEFQDVSRALRRVGIEECCSRHQYVVSHEICEVRENEPLKQIFKLASDKGVQTVRHHNTADWAWHPIIRKITVNPPVVLQIQRDLVCEQRDITDTAAGRTINGELNEQTNQHRAESKGVQGVLERPSDRGDVKTRPPL